jgi:hypothetical protein
MVVRLRTVQPECESRYPESAFLRGDMPFSPRESSHLSACGRVKGRHRESEGYNLFIRWEGANSNSNKERDRAAYIGVLPNVELETKCSFWGDSINSKGRGPRRCPITSDDFRRCPMMSDDVRWCSMMSANSEHG